MDNKLVYRLSLDEQIPPLVTQVLDEAGWKQWDPQYQHPEDWNLWWKVGKFRYPEPNQLLPWQRLNHYPKSTVLSKKDHLCRALRVCREVYGRGIFNFWPQSFNLPSEYGRFASEYELKQSEEPEKTQYWIVKPAELSRGRGIYVFTDVNELQYNGACIVQQYIERPLLIAGYKFDLRLYVCITNFHPLTIYMHNQGLVRFSTDQYDLSRLDNPYAHLTNTSINKHNPDFLAHVDGGTKWTLAQLRHYLLNTLRVDDRWLWQRVAAIVILTFISQLNSVPRARNCFELFGVDILVDDKLKPWLLEVNYGPQLVCDTITDVKVKKAMIGDLLKLCRFTCTDMDRGHVSQSKRAWRYHSLSAGMAAGRPVTAVSVASGRSHDTAVGTGRRLYEEQRQLARKKAHLEQWQDIENVYPMSVGRGPSAEGGKCVSGEDGDGGGSRGVGVLPPPPAPPPLQSVAASTRYATHPCFNLPSLPRVGHVAHGDTSCSPTPLIQDGGDRHRDSHPLVTSGTSGGFHLLFPFNAATRLGHAASSQDVRRSIAEVRALLRASRQQMNRWPVVNNTTSTTHHNVHTNDDMLLWKPRHL